MTPGTEKHGRARTLVQNESGRKKNVHTHIKNKERNQKTQGINNRDRKKRARAAAPCPCLTTLVQSVSQLAS